MILNDCVAPFEPKTELIVSVSNFQSQIIDHDSGAEFSDVFKLPANYINDGGWSTSKYTVQEDGVYTFVLEYEFEFATAQPGDEYPEAPVLSYRPDDGSPFVQNPSTTIKGYPETPASGVKYKVTQTWNNIPLEVGTGGNEVYMQVEDTVGDDIAMLVSVYPTLKIYKAE